MKAFDNIAVFGCKATTAFLLKSLDIPYRIKHLISISPESGVKHSVADYWDLRAIASSKNIETYTSKYYSLKHPDDIDYINNLGIDIAFVIGWQRLIPAEILSGLTIGAFGMHGSSMDLPLGRGRSPMNWSIIEGRRSFYTNLFRYDPGVDSGEVVDTLKFQITSRDNAETMHFKNALAMKYLIEQNVDKLVHNDFTLEAQDDSLSPSYYPKRKPSDSMLDWNLDVYALDRFIRAVSRPFNGAFTFVGDEKVTIHEAQVFDVHDFGYEKAKAGTVVTVFENGKFLVRSYGGLLLVKDHFSTIEITQGMRFCNNGHALHHFDRNPQGNFDLIPPQIQP